MQAVCVECVSRGLHGPTVIGMDKPCVEEFTGGRDLWEHKERRGRVGTRRKGGKRHGECGERNLV